MNPSKKCTKDYIEVVDQFFKCVGVLSMNTSTLLKMSQTGANITAALRIGNSVGFCIDAILTPLIDPPNTTLNKISMGAKLVGGFLMLGGTIASVAGAGIGAGIASGVGLCGYTAYTISKASQMNTKTPTCDKVAVGCLLGCLGMKFATTAAQIAGSTTAVATCSVIGATCAVAYSIAGIAGLFQKKPEQEHSSSETTLEKETIGIEEESESTSIKTITLNMPLDSYNLEITRL